jgi:release factor glutamine methyltransferase
MSGAAALNQALSRAASHLERAGVPEPRPDAEILLAHILGCSRTFLAAHPADPLAPQALQQFEAAVRLRSTRRPLVYITGRTEFYGLEFEISDAVMVPRPETELLVEETISMLKRAASPSPRVLDIATGSGCIAVAIAAHILRARLLATDLSSRALQVAKRNAILHGVADRIRLVACDIFSGLRAAHAFDAVVSNPPYVATPDIDDLQPEIRDHEPRIALDGGNDGLAVTREITSGVAGYVKGGGIVALEIGIDQAEEVVDALQRAGLVRVSVSRDYSGLPRVVTGHKPAAG